MLRPLIGVTPSRFQAAAMACHCWTLSPRSYFLPRYWKARRSAHAMPTLMVSPVTPRDVDPPLSTGALVAPVALDALVAPPEDAPAPPEATPDALVVAPEGVAPGPVVTSGPA